MKTTLPKIPQKRLDELNLIIDSIRDELWNKKIEIEKIILFWSYARGGFVEKDVNQVWHHKEVYRSDFDIMIITKKDLWEEAGWLSLYITDKITKKRKTKTPITLIIEDLKHVNDMLQMWRYFYSDIKKEWILLLDNSWIELAEYRVLTKKERLEMMKEDYDLWFPSADSFFEWYKDFYNRNDLNWSAFLLHQVTEKYITAYLLVRTSYKERTHDLWHLYDDLIINDKRFENWFDFEKKWEFEKFNLLKDAYVRARYDKDYKITEEELEFLEKKVLILRDLVEELCKEEMGK